MKKQMIQSIHATRTHFAKRGRVNFFEYFTHLEGEMRKRGIGSAADKLREEMKRHVQVTA